MWTWDKLYDKIDTGRRKLPKDRREPPKGGRENYLREKERKGRRFKYVLQGRIKRKE